MARTPNDPTKAQAWLWGTPPDLEMELYIPRGAKGEPGGIVLGTILGTADLNSIVTPGVYRQVDSSGNSAGLARNYPTAGGYGTVLVYQTHALIPDVIQEYYPQSYNAAHDARLRYWRNRSNNVWSPWRVLRTSRFDQTAGRTFYEWDDLNNREQLVYGDTGWRGIANDPNCGLIAAGNFFGATNGGAVADTLIKIRRIGTTVWISSAGAIQPKQDYTNTTNRIIILPVGFRGSTESSHIVVRYGNNGSDTGQRPVFLGPGGNWGNPAYLTAVPMMDANWNNTAPGTTWPKLYGGVWLYGCWETTDAWPTTLPGVASGPIPNL